MTSATPKGSNALQKTLHDCLRDWPTVNKNRVKSITSLRSYRQRLLDNPHSQADASLATIRTFIDDTLSTLAEHNSMIANLLKQRFTAKMTVNELAKAQAVSPSQIYSLQKQGLEQLTRILLTQEQDALFTHRLAVEARLDALGHRRLFGIESLRQQLQALVIKPEAPWLICLEGLGGIGKTSLADRLVRDLISGDRSLNSRFLDIAWVSARQENFLPASGIISIDKAALTAESLIDQILNQFGHDPLRTASSSQKEAYLHRLLKQHAYLIVIDNLETAADYQALIPTLRQLANPSKFLLTNRHSLQAYADLFSLNLTELDQPCAIELLRHEAKQKGLTAVATATSAQLDEIYGVVGGNPLALRLVLGQIQALPLKQVLQSLRQAKRGKSAQLYHYIYWQSWHALSQESQQTLLAFALTSSRGGTVDYLQTVAELPSDSISHALEELIAFSLVDVGGDLDNRSYSIHRLTETFLLSELTQWPSSL